MSIFSSNQLTTKKDKITENNYKKKTKYAEYAIHFSHYFYGPFRTKTNELS